MGDSANAESVLFFSGFLAHVIIGPEFSGTFSFIAYPKAFISEQVT